LLSLKNQYFLVLLWIVGQWALSSHSYGSYYYTME
jgi:hypothetical protein